MTGNPDRLPADEQASAADLRMAGLLADGFRPSPDLRRALRLESGEEADDILGRINVLDFLDSVVGDVGNELPERLGDYRIIGLLGRGGMGTVFEAYQESLERVVPLKLLAPSRTADPRMRKRLRTEARANANLHQQQILPIRQERTHRQRQAHGQHDARPAAGRRRDLVTRPLVGVIEQVAAQREPEGAARSAERQQRRPDADAQGEPAQIRPDHLHGQPAGGHRLLELMSRSVDRAAAR